MTNKPKKSKVEYNPDAPRSLEPVIQSLFDKMDENNKKKLAPPVATHKPATTGQGRVVEYTPPSKPIQKFRKYKPEPDRDKVLPSDRTPEVERELIARLVKVHKVQTTTYDTVRMVKFIQTEVNRMRAEDPDSLYVLDIHEGNVYVTKSSDHFPAEDLIYPCVVAHTDTVHDIYHDFHVLRSGDRLIAYDHGENEQVGIGGDDKVGIFVALEMLRQKPNLKAAFFRDEEHGCLGSGVAKQSFFEDTGYIFQCDRQGYEDVVQRISGTLLFDDLFEQALEHLFTKYGRKVTTFGGITDVGELADNFYDRCVTNLSCGYYKPHTDKEYLRISHVLATLDFVSEAIDTLGEAEWLNTYHYDRNPGKKDAWSNPSWGTSSWSKDSWSKDAWSKDAWSKDAWSKDAHDDVWDGRDYDREAYDKVMSKYADDRLGEPSQEQFIYSGDCPYIIDVRDFDDVDYLLEAEETCFCPNCGHSLEYDDTQDAEFCMECNDYVVGYVGYPEGVYQLNHYIRHARDMENKRNL